MTSEVQNAGMAARVESADARHWNPAQIDIEDAILDSIINEASQKAGCWYSCKTRAQLKAFLHVFGKEWDWADPHW